MRSKGFLVGVALLLFGCTTSPPYPSKTLNVAEINNAILTELYCAAIRLQGINAVNIYWPPPPSPPGLPNNLYFNSQDNWVAAIDLYLSASVDGVASPAVSLLGPFNMARSVAPAGGTAGSFTALFGASFDQTRTNLREYKVYIFLPELIRTWQPPLYTDCNDPNQGRTYLAGTLGFEDWLAPAVTTLEKTQALAPDPNGYTPKTSSLWIDRTKVARRHTVSPKIVRVADNNSSDPNKTHSDDVQPPQADTNAAALAALDYFLANQNGGGGGSQPPTISTTLTFTIKATGTLGPSFALTRVSGGSGSAFTLSRTDNNYVNIVLTPATYCPTAIIYTTPSGSPPNTPQTASCIVLAPIYSQERGLVELQKQTRESLNKGVPTPQDMQAATNRLDSALSNLNLAHLVTP
jgi:hypothetical protein